MKKLFFAIACIAIMLSCFGTSVFAASENDGIMLLNNTFNTESLFIIENGEAKVIVSYIGLVGITSGATITTKLQKRAFWFIWSDVTEWVDTSYEVDGTFEHSYPVDSGDYRVKIKYEISGSGGATDVIEEEREYSC